MAPDDENPMINSSPPTATYSTANKIFAFLAGNGSAGLSADRHLPARAGHLWYSHLLSRWRHL